MRDQAATNTADSETIRAAFADGATKQGRFVMPLYADAIAALKRLEAEANRTAELERENQQLRTAAAFPAPSSSPVPADD